MIVASRTLIPRLVPAISSLQRTRPATYSTFFGPCTDPVYNNNTLGPWPRTKEERERAARKYNLIPEDYEPHDENDAYGDYPKLKAIGAFNRDKYDDYDDPVDMRFYGEVFHVDYDLYYWERIDPLEDEKGYPPVWLRLLVVIGTALTFPTMMWLFDHYRIQINHPWKCRQSFPDQQLYEFPISQSNHHQHH